MFWRQTIKNNKNGEILEKIKGEIQTQLHFRGVSISSINMQINSNNISLTICINGSKRLA